MNEPITITLSQQPAHIFKEFDIVVWSIYKNKTWSLIYHVENHAIGQETASLRILNVSRWSLIRKIELKILRKLLKNRELTNKIKV